METIYRFEDKVFDFRFGWGKIIDIIKSSYPIRVNFENGVKDIGYTLNGKYSNEDKIPTLSFTEYNLVTGGFSQIRPILKGDLVFAWDSKEDIKSKKYVLVN